MRQSEILRKTGETDITLRLCLDGKGTSDIETGCGFLNHMLTLFAKHGRFDLWIRCKGDTDVDFHHTTEDIGICLGDAFREALGDMRGVTRYGHCILPMDETLIMTATDLSGRGKLVWRMKIPTEKVGVFDTELAEEFFEAFIRHAGITLHVRQLAGRNSHHILEGAFKSTARTLRAAVRIDPDMEGEIPSTKGLLI